MYYFYDLLLNFNEVAYEFYEWEEDDDIEFIKKIPLFKVSKTCFKDLLEYKVKFKEDLLLKIKNKTIVKNKSTNLLYAMLVSDGKNALALELNKDGKVAFVSKLLLSDEENLIEIMFTIKETKLEYEKEEKRKSSIFIRRVENIKKIIKLELDNLYKDKNILKIKYLYLEWFNEISDDPKYMYEKMQKALKNEVSDKEISISNLIKLSYSK